MSSKSCQSQQSSLAHTKYNILIWPLDHASDRLQGSKRALARLEGHDDPKALHPWTQFLAAGLGGIISQSAH